MPLPEHAGYPGGAARAAWHIEEAIRVFTRAFGARPAGCWPAEGAISAATLAVLAAHGFRWAASSAAVLRGSLALADAQAADEPRELQPPVPHPPGTGSTASSATTLSPTSSASPTRPGTAMMPHTTS